MTKIKDLPDEALRQIKRGRGSKEGMSASQWCFTLAAFTLSSTLINHITLPSAEKYAETLKAQGLESYTDERLTRESIEAFGENGSVIYQRAELTDDIVTHFELEDGRKAEVIIAAKKSYESALEKPQNKRDARLGSGIGGSILALLSLGFALRNKFRENAAKKELDTRIESRIEARAGHTTTGPHLVA